MQNPIKINTHNFPIDIGKYGIVCKIQNSQFKILNSNHGIFTKSFKKHFHSFYELHCIIGGKGTLITDDNEFVLTEGIVYLNGPRQNHTQLTDPDNYMEEFHLSFDLKLGKNHNKIFTELEQTKFWIGMDSYNILENFKELEQELYSQKPGWTLAAETLFSRIIIAVIRNISLQYLTPNIPPVPDDIRLRLIDDAFIYSYKNITLPSLSNLLNLGERQLQRLIKEKYGVSFVKLRNRVRMDAAADMLENSPELSIDRICENIGLSTEAYFTKKFKAFFGITPLDYRKSRNNAKDKK